MNEESCSGETCGALGEPKLVTANATRSAPIYSQSYIRGIRMQQPPAAAPSFHPAWNSLSTFIWAALIILVIVVFRKELRVLFQLLNRRVRLGAGIKLGSLEVSQAYVDPGGGKVTGGAVRAVRVDSDGKRHAQREQYYQPNRLLMLVHRIVPSEHPDQLYDILLYLVPHPTTDASLVGVKHVEYYFGKSWGRKVFQSVDRANGFAIATSAYGPFVCTAEIHFADGEVVTVSRYVDFEMGAIGSLPQPPATKPNAIETASAV